MELRKNPWVMVLDIGKNPAVFGDNGMRKDITKEDVMHWMEETKNDPDKCVVVYFSRFDYKSDSVADFSLTIHGGKFTNYGLGPCPGPIPARLQKQPNSNLTLDGLLVPISKDPWCERIEGHDHSGLHQLYCIGLAEVIKQVLSGTSYEKSVWLVEYMTQLQ